MIRYLFVTCSLLVHGCIEYDTYFEMPLADHPTTQRVLDAWDAKFDGTDMETSGRGIQLEREPGPIDYRVHGWTIGWVRLKDIGYCATIPREACHLGWNHGGKYPGRYIVGLTVHYKKTIYILEEETNDFTVEHELLHVLQGPDDPMHEDKRVWRELMGEIEGMGRIESPAEGL